MLIPGIHFVIILLRGAMHFEWWKSAVYKAAYEVFYAGEVKNVSAACSAQEPNFAMVYLCEYLDPEWDSAITIILIPRTNQLC